MIVSIHNGDIFTNGLADRLRGIITSYALAKHKNIPFRIVHIHPFCLEKYLIPNEYDWATKENEITYNLKTSTPICIIDRTKGYRLLLLFFCRQYHIYSNVDALELFNKIWSESFTYSQLFNQLFKPSDLLNNNIAKFKEYINIGYISVSFRFMQLMGDFKDVRGKILNKNEQLDLMKKCTNIIHDLHKKHQKYHKILVTSDSITFIEHIKELDFIFYIPGPIGHIGYSNNEDVSLKTISDFYMISQAKKAYMAYNDQMYKSCFARDAAMTTNIPYEAIKF